MNIHSRGDARVRSRIGQSELGGLIASVGGAREVEDLYPLSALQQGLLFHSLYEPQSTVYVTTLSCRLVGALDAQAFEQAWQSVVARHTVLRTAFVGQDLEHPVRVVLGRAPRPFRHHDWRDFGAAEQEARLASLYESDRARGFDSAPPPLMRLHLMQLAAA